MIINMNCTLTCLIMPTISPEVILCAGNSAALRCTRLTTVRPYKPVLRPVFRYKSICKGNKYYVFKNYILNKNGHNSNAWEIRREINFTYITFYVIDPFNPA